MKRHKIASRRAIIGSIIAVTGLTAMDAAAAEAGGGSFRIRASVPVACWVRPDSVLNAIDGATGIVTEACNSPGGYRVTAQHRALATDERASMIYDDHIVDLALGGDKIVSLSDRARIRKVGYRFTGINLQAPLVIALTIQPI